MKYAANRIAKKLESSGIPTAVIHGNKSQNARQRAIQDFANNKVDVMLATDIASRGIDIDGITHVINYQLSNMAESYVHRIGRTARAGAKGKAISLVTADEKSFLVNIERVTKQKIVIDKDQPFHSGRAEEAAIVKVGKAKAKIESERKKEARQSRGRKPRRKTKGKSKKTSSHKKSSSRGRRTRKKTSR